MIVWIRKAEMGISKEVMFELNWADQISSWQHEEAEFYTEVIFKSKVQRRRHLAHSKSEKACETILVKEVKNGDWWVTKLGPRKLMKVKVKSLSPVRLFATPWTIAYHVPLSMGFSRQEYWSRLPFPSPEDLPNPGIDRTRVSRIVGRCFTIWATREDVTVKLMRLCKISFILSVLAKYLRQQEGKKK